jgi:hypothetical protein
MGLSYLSNCFKEHVHSVLGLSQAHLQQQGTNYTHTVYSFLTRFDDFILCLLQGVMNEHQQSRIQDCSKPAEIIDLAVDLMNRLIQDN